MAMAPRQRLLASLAGKPVDRPAVNFYETGRVRRRPGDPDSFNIYNDPSWRPLLRLAEEHTDLIRNRAIPGGPGAGRTSAGTLLPSRILDRRL